MTKNVGEPWTSFDMQLQTLIPHKKIDDSVRAIVMIEFIDGSDIMVWLSKMVQLLMV